MFFKPYAFMDYQNLLRIFKDYKLIKLQTIKTKIIRKMLSFVKSNINVFQLTKILGYVY